MRPCQKNQNSSKGSDFPKFKLLWNVGGTRHSSAFQCSICVVVRGRTFLAIFILWNFITRSTRKNKVFFRRPKVKGSKVQNSQKGLTPYYWSYLWHTFFFRFTISVSRALKIASPWLVVMDMRSSWSRYIPFGGFFFVRKGWWRWLWLTSLRTGPTWVRITPVRLEKVWFGYGDQYWWWKCLYMCTIWVGFRNFDGYPVLFIKRVILYSCYTKNQQTKPKKNNNKNKNKKHKTKQKHKTKDTKKKLDLPPIIKARTAEQSFGRVMKLANTGSTVRTCILWGSISL